MRNIVKAGALALALAGGCVAATFALPVAAIETYSLVRYEVATGDSYVDDYGLTLSDCIGEAWKLDKPGIGYACERER